MCMMGGYKLKAIDTCVVNEAEFNIFCNQISEKATKKTTIFGCELSCYK